MQRESTQIVMKDDGETDMNIPIDVSNTTLETDRLLIRPWSMTDLEDFFKYAKIDGVGQMAVWEPHKSIEESKEISTSFIENKRTFALEIKSNHKVIGSLGLEEIVIDLGEPYQSLRGREVGYVLSKDYWGRGFMPEAVRELIRYCFEELDCDFLQCTHSFSNERSRRVIDKVGFQFIRDDIQPNENGTQRETKVYVMRNPGK